MKYMMFVCTDSEPDTDLTDNIHTWVADNDARGRRLDGDALAPTSTATTVRVRNGELLLSDGRSSRPIRAIGWAPAMPMASSRWAHSGGPQPRYRPAAPRVRRTARELIA